MSSKKPEAAEIEVLYPERSVTIAGELVTVRELAFAETLRLEPEMAPLVRAFIELPADDEEQQTSQFAQLFGAHAHAWMGFMATACGKPREWIEHLPDEAGRMLSMLVWTVNSSFFTRRVISGMIARQNAHSVQQHNAPSTTASSMPH